MRLDTTQSDSIRVQSRQIDQVEWSAGDRRVRFYSSQWMELSACGLGTRLAKLSAWEPFTLGYPVPAQALLGVEYLGRGKDTARMEDREFGIHLVNECLSGSEQAWDEFYDHYVSLVRSVVRRKLKIAAADIDDVVQCVFADLVPALKTYDGRVTLTRFICMITERVCVNEYHRLMAAKRYGQTESIDHDCNGHDGSPTLAADCDSPEDLLAREELKHILRQAVWNLGHECWKILTLKEFEGVPYREMAEILGQKENTLTVKARRCLDELKAAFLKLLRAGCRR